MSFAIVSPDGRYHGHTATEQAAKDQKAKSLKDIGPLRLLTDEEWKKVAENRPIRADLCGTLGKAL